MTSIFTAIARLAGFLASLATVLMMLHITIAVVVRVVFNYPLLGTNAIVSYFYMVVATFLGIFVTSWQDAHIRVDVVANLFRPGMRRVTEVLAEIISLVFYVCFAWGLMYTALQQTRQHEQVDAIFAYVTIWPIRWVAAAGIALATIVVMWRLMRAIAGSPDLSGPHETAGSVGRESSP